MTCKSGSQPSSNHTLEKKNETVGLLLGGEGTKWGKVKSKRCGGQEAYKSCGYRHQQQQSNCEQSLWEATNQVPMGVRASDC